MEFHALAAEMCENEGVDNFSFYDQDEDPDALSGSITESMVIAVAADPDTWLPQIVLGLPVDPEVTWPEGPLEGCSPLTLTPEEAYQIGAYLIQAATTVSSFYIELIGKTVEERQEIMTLETQLLLDDPDSAPTP